jgi:hypothetical protein
VQNTVAKKRPKTPFQLIHTWLLAIYSSPRVRYLRRLPIDHPRLLALGKAIIVFLFFFMICFCTLDPDFGWHLMAGNYFRAHGIPSHDVFTYTARNFPWIDHEWANDVLISYLYQLQGYLLVSLFFAAIWTIGLLLNAWRARFAILLVALAAMLPYATIRPTAWTVLGLAIMLRILLNKKPGKTILYLPLLFLFWANLHGGFVLGLAILFYFVIIRKSKPLLLILLLCLLATLINPYGPRLYVEIFRTLTDWQLHTQTEGMSVFHLPSYTWELILLWGAGFWLFARKKLINWFSVSPLLLLTSLVATRNVPLFTMAATPELNRYYTSAKYLIPKSLPRLAKIIYRSMVVIAIVIPAYFVISGSIPTSNRETSYPVAAVAYLKTHQCNGNLYNDFNYGGFLIWQLPQYPVYIDGRMPSWRNPQGVKYIDIYLKISVDPTLQQSIFKQYNVTCALVENNGNWQGFINRLRAQGWQAPVITNDSILLIRPH